MVTMSVHVGQLLIPARSLESLLGAYAQNLIVWNHDEVFKIGLLGSCTPLKYRSRYFLLCTKHQIGGVDPKDLCLLRKDGSSVVTSNGVRFWGTSGTATETDAYDLAILDFSDACKIEADLRHYFFGFSEVPPDTTSDRVIALIGAGYPSADQVYELLEANHVGLVRRVMLLLADGQPSDQAILRARTQVPMNFSADGLSGGPVFMIQIVGQEFKAFFAGMIQRAGGGFVHFLKAGFIKAALDATIDASERA
jgi:hypothetical protein